MSFALSVVLGWSRLRLVMLIAFAVIAIGIVFQVLGDYQVAHSIWRTSGNPGFGNGYVAGHDRSGFGDLLVLVGGLAFAVTADVGRLVPRRWRLSARSCRRPGRRPSIEASQTSQTAFRTPVKSRYMSSPDTSAPETAEAPATARASGSYHRRSAAIFCWRVRRDSNPQPSDP